MTSAVSQARWKDAQAAESGYWSSLCFEPAEFARIVSEKVEFSTWAAQALEGELPDGSWLEVGIGPLGIGCLQLLPGAELRQLIGVDPLPLIDLANLSLPSPLHALAETSRRLLHEYTQAPGEMTGLTARRFSFVACYNVLDHVRDPLAVLVEANRVSELGARLALSCDVTSLLSDLRHRWWVRHRRSSTIGVRAHPFRFKEYELRRLLEKAGFGVVSSRGVPGAAKRAAGRSARPAFLCEKLREVQT
jgi:hypothetical protein